MYGAIVVGARCAAAPTAMLLARRGYKVLLVDRATFPSNIPHGHLIHRHGPRLLHRWGLLDRVIASGCPPITTRVSDADGIGFAYGPRRLALDTILLEAAVEAGVEFRDGIVIDEFVGDGERVVGIRGRQAARSGAAASPRARAGPSSRASTRAPRIGRSTARGTARRQTRRAAT